MYLFKILTRNRKTELGRIVADSEKEAVKKWYLSGKSKYEVVVAEIYGLAPNEQKNNSNLRK